MTRIGLARDFGTACARHGRLAADSSVCLRPCRARCEQIELLKSACERYLVELGPDDQNVCVWAAQRNRVRTTRPRGLVYE